ncbi:MAG: hypothetical protein IT371_08035 [Deltaproteobacteria bacterium]|nr:hypothetical protein [Deltaproteobacteria bacterium]
MLVRVATAIVCAVLALPRHGSCTAPVKEPPQKVFERARLPYPAAVVYLRAFKHEGELELWAGGAGEPLQLVKRYAICARSGRLGPKAAEGDGQVPEGFYRITAYNPRSRFHRSLGIDYPNRADRLRSTARRLGGEIYIHGKCVTIGCLPIEDGPAEELFDIAVQHRRQAQGGIAVHIFPRRMDREGMTALAREAGRDARLLAFWESLAPAYRQFEAQRRVPRVSIEADGRYQVRATAAP